jgi:ribosomal protein S18 acetylase RimI-like enzyme
VDSRSQEEVPGEQSDRCAGDGGRRQAVPPVRPVYRADVGALSRSLARAFVSDPVSAYLFPGAKRRRRRLERYFRFQLKTAFLDKGVCYTTDDLTSAALFMPPQELARPTIHDVVSQLPAIFVLGRSLSRAMRLVQLLDLHHPKGPHYYLATIGTVPEAQSKGLGAAVMAPVLRRCDDSRTPAYLEASTERSVAFYERYGFEVRRRVTIPGTDVRLWLMWREPPQERYASRMEETRGSELGPAAPE